MVSAIVRRLTNYLKPGACPLIVQSVNNLRYPDRVDKAFCFERTAARIVCRDNANYSND